MIMSFHHITEEEFNRHKNSKNINVLAEMAKRSESELYDNIEVTLRIVSSVKERDHFTIAVRNKYKGDKMYLLKRYVNWLNGYSNVYHFVLKKVLNEEHADVYFKEKANKINESFNLKPIVDI